MNRGELQDRLDKLKGLISTKEKHDARNKAESEIIIEFERLTIDLDMANEEIIDRGDKIKALEKHCSHLVDDILEYFMEEDVPPDISL